MTHTSRWAVALTALLAGWLGVAQAQPVCAEVKIEILQRVSMERQAFDATLRINNALEGIEVTDLEVQITFKDEFGSQVLASSNPDTPGAMFFIRENGFDGISGGVSGSGTVEASSVGEARWLIIPAAASGGEDPRGRNYEISAKVSYRLGDMDASSVDVTPETITVKPQPVLQLDYFLPLNVFSDDPFTEEVEPAEPFTLGVRVSNVGKGQARRLQIESGQPTIVENLLGLLIDFEIIGSSVGAESGRPSLTVDLGDLDPGESRIARWRMITSLNGRFTDFNASFTHAPELGGALTSLLKAVNTYELVREVRVPSKDGLANRDDVVDFLAYQRPGDVLKVYESHGIDTEVADESASAAAVHLGSGRFRFDVPTTVGFAYASVPVALTSTALQVSAVRSDNSPLPRENVWVSKVQSLDDQSYSYYLNIFDIQFSGSYTVAIEDALLPAALEGLVYFDADGDGERGGAEPGIAGVAVALLGTLSDGFGVRHEALTDAAGNFAFPDLAPGTYSLEVGEAPGMVNGVHAPGSSGGSVGANTISGIEIAAGTRSTGYMFGKRERGTEDGADLAVQLILASPPRKLTDPFELLVRVENHGPRDAGEIQLDLELPAASVMETFEPSVGTFDRDTMRWSLPGAASGQSFTLTVRGRITRPGTHRASAFAFEHGEAGFDPDERNNSAFTEFTVDPWALAAELTAWARVLVLAGCELDPASQQACVEAGETGDAVALAEFIEELSPAASLVTADPAAFVDALIDGDWSVVWVRGQAEVLERPVVNDLRMAMLRGARVVVSADLHEAPSSLTALLGVEAAGASSTGAFAIASPPGGPVDSGTFQGWGRFGALSAGPEDTLATFVSGGVAIAERRAGLGRVWVFGFEPLAAASPVLSSVLTPPLLAFAQPHHSSRTDTSGIVAVMAELSAGTAPQPVTLTASWPESIVLGTDPANGVVQPGRVVWTTTPEAESVTGYRAEFRAPSQMLVGDLLQVSATRESGDGEVSIDGIEVPVAVVDFPGFAETAAEHVARFEDGDTEADALRRAALDAIGDALTHHFAGTLGARQSVLDAATSVLAHPNFGADRLLALESLGYGYRILRRDDRTEPPECPVDPGVPGLLASSHFAAGTPHVGVAMEGTMRPSSEWNIRTGRLESTNPREYSLHTVTPVNGEQLRFVYRRNWGLSTEFSIWRGETQISRGTSRQLNLDSVGALRIHASLEAVTAVLPPSARLVLSIDRINGVEVPASISLAIPANTEDALHLVMPQVAGVTVQSIEGRLTPRYETSRLSETRLKLGILQGRVDCGSLP